jgi:tetratricopeptide (TPR) repeat protein
MKISNIALNRMLEESAAKNTAQREHLERTGRPILSAGRKMSDVELLEKLKSFNVIVDKEQFDAWHKKFVSAQELTEWIITTQKPAFEKDIERDWIWVVLTVLWERWFPESPSLEMIDDQMQAGYDLLHAGEVARACEPWLSVWKALLKIANAYDLKSLNELDDAFGGSQYLFNWVQDMEMELGNAGLRDRRFLHERARFCEVFVNRFPQKGELIDENMKRAWAESCFRIGETEKAEALLQQWLRDDPAWGWGWITWSDCHRDLGKGDQDLGKAEKILRDGLAVKGVRDKKEIQNRLNHLNAQPGNERKLSESHVQLAGRENVKLETTISAEGNVLRLKQEVDFREEGVPVEEFSNIQAALQAGLPEVPAPKEKKRKIGRNDPCPCGSGKKFKHCYGNQ